ncbi:MAG: LysR family transcriptional regulator [Polyangiaceae bacterium]|nr:LysR family transcriptional regulator [Polyangiaceae bacterium]
MNGSEVNDVLLFLSVVESGSFVAGGRAFGLSRSAAGKAIARLEDRFAARLLNRTTRALDLTDAGRSLYENGLAMRAAIEATEAGASGSTGTPRGVLRITLPDALGRRVMLPLVRRYLDEWPEVQVEVSFSDRISNLVEDGFDLAVRIDVSSPDRSLVARTIMTDEAIVVAAPSYLDARGRPTSTQQLSTHDLLFFATRNERQAWRLLEADGTWVRAHGRSRLRVDSGAALRDAALAGMGIALLPACLVEEDIATGRLQRVLPRATAGTVKIVALYPHKRLLEPKVRHFVDLLASALAQARKRRPTPHLRG